MTGGYSRTQPAAGWVYGLHGLVAETSILLSALQPFLPTSFDPGSTANTAVRGKRHHPRHLLSLLDYHLFPFCLEIFEGIYRSLSAQLRIPLRLIKISNILSSAVLIDLIA